MLAEQDEVVPLLEVAVEAVDAVDVAADVEVVPWVAEVELDAAVVAVDFAAVLVVEEDPPVVAGQEVAFTLHSQVLAWAHVGEPSEPHCTCL